MVARLNQLRPGVLDANDGVVSTAGLVGVAGATKSTQAILTDGVAGQVAGAVSMALGEFVSVSCQRDSESAHLGEERRELAETPKEELTELALSYEGECMYRHTARESRSSSWRRTRSARTPRPRCT